MLVIYSIEKICKELVINLNDVFITYIFSTYLGIFHVDTLMRPDVVHHSKNSYISELQFILDFDK